MSKQLSNWVIDTITIIYFDHEKSFAQYTWITVINARQEL